MDFEKFVQAVTETGLYWRVFNKAPQPQAIMNNALRILILEDKSADTELILEELRRAGLLVNPRRVAHKESFCRELKDHPPDVILADFDLPQFNALDALKLQKRNGCDAPFILVTGAQSEEVAVECIKAGADDYILKSSLRRLPAAILNALNKRAAERAKEQAERALRQSEELNRRILDCVPGGIVEVSKEGAILVANGEAQKFLGLSFDEIKKLYVSDFKHQTIWEDGSVCAVEDYPVSKCLLTGQPQTSASLGVRRPDGVVSWGVFSAIPLLDPGTGSAAGAVVTFVDITEHKRMELAMRESQAKFQIIFEKSLDAMGVSKAGIHILQNPAYLAMFGYSNDSELNGTSILNLIAPCDCERMRENVRKRYTGEPLPSAYECRAIKKDGTEFDMDVNCSTYFQSGERYSLVILRDITERKRAEQALRESESRLRLLVEQMPAVMWSIDLNERFTSSSGTGLAVLNARPNRIVGKSLVEYFETPDAAFPPIAAHRRALKGESSTYEFKWQERVFQTHVEAFRASDGTITGAIGVALDITDRKGTEDALRKQLIAVETSMDGMAILNASEEYTYLNSAHARLYGYNNPSELLGKSWRILYEPDEIARFERDVLPMLGVSGRWHGEAVGRKRDGSTYPQEISLSKVESGGLVCVVHDITGRKQAEEARLALERKLLETQKLESLGVLAGGIAHDFNNLLAAILGNASLASMQTPPDSPIRSYLSSIESTTQRAADLCKQMLAYAGKGRIATQMVRVNAVIEDIAGLLNISIGRNIMLKFNLAKDLPPLMADATQIRQVVMNLIINASEAIGEKEGAISLNTSLVHADKSYLAKTYLAPELPDGEYVLIEVADTGCGMDTETKSKIFDPFFTTKFTGRGLGLAAVLGIVRGHKGAILIESTPERGTTFKILLPSTQEPVSKPEMRTPGSSPWHGSGTVLVAEDEQQLRALHGQMLEIFGFTPLLAADGVEAVEIFKAHPMEIAAVLLDMSMPRMNGVETYNALRRIRADVRVILMSGNSPQDLSGEFAENKIAGFLQKPFTLQELCDQLRAIFEF